jgi:esterase/lipase superfamily enzyme
MATRFVVTTRKVDDAGAYLPEPGPTQFLLVPSGTTSYTPAHQASSDSAWRDRLIAAAKRSVANTVTGMQGDVLIFVHGYNNSIQEILQRTDLLQATLNAEGWQGVVVAFDWPSDNFTLNYLEDRKDASAVAGRLVQELLPLLVDAQELKDANGQPVCTINVHLLGHSTGAFVIMEAFSFAEKIGRNFKSDYRIGQVGFIGADVSADSLDADCQWAAPMFRRINRITNYSNGFDSVLAVSNAKRLGTSPRIGRVGATPKAHSKAVNVDTSEYFATKDPSTSQFVGTFCHSWHIGDALWARDFAMTLDGRIDRQVLPTRLTNPKLHLNPKGPARPQFEHLWEITSPNG